MTASRSIAEPWISEYGADTPAVLRAWAAELAAAPTAARLLEEAAGAAEALLRDGQDEASVVDPGAIASVAARLSNRA